VSIFITSDTHFCHPGVIKSRPRFQSQNVKDIMAEMAAADYNEHGATRLQQLKSLLKDECTLCLPYMHEEIINRWNAVVTPRDAVYHLGDFALTWGKAKSWDEITKILGRLNGQKFLIKGNHDRDEVIKQPGWGWVRDYYELKLGMHVPDKQRVCLFHYSQRAWNQMHRGAWMLYGHSHGNLPDIGGKTLEMGMDASEFSPNSIEAIAEKMKHRPILLAGDHHTFDHA